MTHLSTKSPSQIILSPSRTQIPLTRRLLIVENHDDSQSVPVSHNFRFAFSASPKVHENWFLGDLNGTLAS